MLLYGDEPRAEPVYFMANHQHYHDNLTVISAMAARVAGVSGALLKPHVVQLPPGTKWQVTRANGCPHGYATPGGAASGVEGRSRALGSLCAHGAEVEVEAECGLWVRIKAEVPTWVEMDAFFMG